MCRDVSQCVETGRANLLVPQELTSKTTLKRRIACRLKLEKMLRVTGRHCVSLRVIERHYASKGYFPVVESDGNALSSVGKME